MNQKYIYTLDKYRDIIPTKNYSFYIFQTLLKISEQLITNMASMPLLGNVTSSAQRLKHGFGKRLINPACHCKHNYYEMYGPKPLKSTSRHVFFGGLSDMRHRFLKDSDTRHGNFLNLTGGHSCFVESPHEIGTARQGPHE